MIRSTSSSSGCAPAAVSPPADGHVDQRVDRAQPGAGCLGLRLADLGIARGDHPVEVADLDQVVVHQQDVAPKPR